MSIMSSQKQFFLCLRTEQIYFFLGLSPENFSGYVFRAYAHYHNQIYSLFGLVKYPFIQAVEPADRQLNLSSFLVNV